MRIDGGSGYPQPGGTSRFDATPDEGLLTAQAAPSAPADASWQTSHQSGATAVRSSGYRRPLRGENHCGSLLNHLPLQNNARRPNPYIHFPDRDLLKAANIQFTTLKKLNEN